MARSLKNLYPEKYDEFLKSDKYRLRSKTQIESNAAKTVCKELANYKCAHCGRVAIDAHHIVPIEVGGKDEQENLICLCRACHQQVHKGVYNIDKQTKKITAVINPIHVINEENKAIYIKDFEKLHDVILYKNTGPYYYFKNNIKYTITVDELKAITGYTAEKEAEKQARKERLKIKEQSIKDRKLLAQYKEMLKSSGNKAMWHEVCKVIKLWDTLDAVQKEHVFETLHNFFSKYGKTL